MSKFDDNVVDILKQIRSKSRDEDKVAILQANRDNAVLKDVLYAAMSPDIKYHIRKIPDYYAGGDCRIGHVTLTGGLHVLTKIAARVYTGSNARLLLLSTLSEMRRKDAKVLTQIVLKELDCGLTASMVNKVWKNWI